MLLFYGEGYDANSEQNLKKVVICRLIGEIRLKHRYDQYINRISISHEV